MCMIIDSNNLQDGVCCCVVVCVTDDGGDT